MPKCPVLVGFSRNGTAKLVYCGQWSCPYCSKKLAGRWAKRTRLQIRQSTITTDTQWFMLTLTLGSGYKDAANAYKTLTKLWDGLRKVFRREHGKAWQYIAFVEGQPKRKFMPHFHIISNAYPRDCANAKGTITKHSTHNFAHKHGWGFEADLKVVVGEAAAAYVSKYASKGGGVVPKHFRRVRTSQGWAKIPVDPDAKLLVRTRNEEMVHFIDRVSAISGVSHEELYNRYTRQMLIMGDLQDM